MPPPARLLDLSRLVSRTGRVPTGVDRVDLAYAARPAADPVPPWGLVRTALGYLLLDREGIGAVVAATRGGGGQPPGASGGSSRGCQRGPRPSTSATAT